ncbi:hypothetical protein [Streptomyces sp. BBFR102]
MTGRIVLGVVRGIFGEVCADLAGADALLGPLRHRVDGGHARSASPRAR